MCLLPRKLELVANILWIIVIENRQCQPLHHVHLAMAKAWVSPTIPISLSSKFQLKLATTFQLSTKRIFLVENEKSERHWILHIRISLGINFHLKQTIQTILTFWTKFVRKGHFSSQTKKETPPLNSAYSN